MWPVQGTGAEPRLLWTHRCWTETGPACPGSHGALPGPRSVFVSPFPGSPLSCLGQEQGKGLPWRRRVSGPWGLPALLLWFPNLWPCGQSQRAAL